MKAFVSGFGGVLFYLSIAWAFFVGIIMLYAWLGWLGVVAGIVVFPVPILFAVGSWLFSSWSSFFSTVIWFGLLLLMINYGDEN